MGSQFRPFDFGFGFSTGLQSKRFPQSGRCKHRSDVPPERQKCTLEWRGIVGRLEEISRGDSVVCFDWIVPDISLMPKRTGAVHYGPQLGFAESLWYCGIYSSDGLLGVELCRTSDSQADFSLGILMADGKEDVRVRKQMFPDNCRRFSFDSFLSELELLQWTSDLASSNNLTIRCTLWTDVPCSDECRSTTSILEEISQEDHRGRSISLDSKQPDIVMCTAKEEEVAEVKFVGKHHFFSDTLTTGNTAGSTFGSTVTRSVTEEGWTVTEALGVPSHSYVPVTGNIREEVKNLKKHVEWDVDFEFLKKHGHVESPSFDFGEQNFVLKLCLYWQGDVEIELHGQGPSCSSVYRCWGGLKYADGTYPTNVRNLELDLKENRREWEIAARLGDFCEFDLKSEYLNSSKKCLTAFARLKANGDSSMVDGLTDSCVQTDECERAAESMEMESLRRLFELWLEHPEEDENIRRICRDSFRTRYKKTSTHLSKPDKK